MGSESRLSGDASGDIPEFPLPSPVVLAIELAGYEVMHLPDRLAAALRSEAVRKSIEKGLNELAAHVAKKTLLTPPDQMSEKEKKEIFSKVIAAATSPIKKDVLDQIKNSSRVRDLERSAQQLARNIDEAAGGIFTDHKYLFIVGSVLVLAGGTVALWQGRAGDAVIKPVLALGAGKLIPSINLGRIEITPELISFSPVNHQVEGKLLMTANWQAVQVKLSLAGKWVEDATSKVSGTGQIILPLGKGVKLTAAGAIGTEKKDAGFALGVTVERGQMDFSVWGTYGNRFADSPAPERTSPADSAGGAGVLATVSYRF